MARHPVVRTQAYLSTHAIPWIATINLLSIYMGVEFTKAAEWGPANGLTPLFAFIWFVLMIVTVGGIAYDLDESRRKYKNKLINKIPERKFIEARVDDSTGKIDIYEVKSNAVGTSSMRLKSFDPEQDDMIHEFVSTEKQRLAGPDLSKAKAIVKVIND